MCLSSNFFHRSLTVLGWPTLIPFAAQVQHGIGVWSEETAIVLERIMLVLTMEGVVDGKPHLVPALVNWLLEMH